MMNTAKMLTRFIKAIGKKIQEKLGGTLIS